MRRWQLDPQARLRRTTSGGAVFLPVTATTVELDAEAFAVVSLLNSPQHARDLRPRLIEAFDRNFPLAEIDCLLRELAERNVLTDGADARTAASSPRSAPGTPPPRVAAPESVHLQLNNVCNLRCPSCYVALQKQDAGSLPLNRIEELIEEWAEMGVFHLALGGGEPLMSPIFAPVVRAARRHQLTPNVTTNGWLIAESLLDQVQDSLGEWRISLNDAETLSLPLLETKAALLQARRLRFGWNLIVTRRNLSRLADLLAWGCGLGAATINLIRPKPAPGNERWYEEHALTGADAARLPAILNELEPLFAQTALTVDCAFSFLFHRQAASALQARGVAGCAMPVFDSVFRFLTNFPHELANNC